MGKLTGNYNVDLSNFEKGLSDLAGDIDDIAQECLDAVSSDLVEAFQRQIRSVTSEKASGELANSISATKARKNQYGNFVAARPVGTHKSGKRNGELLAYLEYGTSRRSANPVRAAAIASAEPKIKSTIERMFNEKVNQRMK